jgi:uncharacterized protein (TIGR00369 family)
MTTTLETWLAEEAKAMAIYAAGSGEGVASRDQIAGKTGLEMMRAILQGELPAAPIGKSMNFCLIHLEEGQTIFQGTPKPAFFNPLGTIHGGWIATLLDSALGCAVHTKMPVGRAYTTAELSVNMVRALSPKVERVRAIANVLHCGRQLATAEAKLVGPDGTLYAHATTTCLVFEVK